MIIPLRTDRTLRLNPWMCYLLIFVNVIVFLMTRHHVDSSTALDEYLLFPPSPQIHQFFTYQFLHGGWMHLIFNMIFLWVFGRDLEDTLGHFGFLFFYLAGGVVAGIGFAVFRDNPVLGASGATWAVTGAYMVLFPMTRVTILFWFLIITTFEVTGLTLIIFFACMDLYMQISGSGGTVAYLAHLSGSVFGVLVAFLLLKCRILPRQPFDLIALIQHRRRRQAFKSMTRDGNSPWQAQAASGPDSTEPADVPLDPQQEIVMGLRADISAALANQDFERAVERYELLLDEDADQVLPLQSQLDVANHAMSQGAHQLAATAYERFRNVYSGDSQVSEVELLLGLLYVRYLNRPDDAKPLLERASERLINPSSKELVTRLLAEIGESKP